MARLGGRIYLSSNVVHRLLVQPYLIRSTLSCVQATMSLQHFLSSIGALKDWRTIRRGSIFGELHNKYADLFLQQCPGPSAINTPRQCLASPTLLHEESPKPSWFQDANASYYNHEPPVHPGTTESASLFDRSALAAQDWTFVAGNETENEYITDPLWVSLFHSIQLFHHLSKPSYPVYILSVTYIKQSIFNPNPAAIY